MVRLSKSATETWSSQDLVQVNARKHGILVCPEDFQVWLRKRYNGMQGQAATY
jgi:hypothetical protein